MSSFNVSVVLYVEEYRTARASQVYCDTSIAVTRRNNEHIG